MTTPANTTMHNGRRGYTVNGTYYIGVTSLIRAALAEPAHLARWKQSRLVNMTLDVRDELEGVLMDRDEIVARAIAKERESSPEAALGTKVHTAIEDFERGGEMSITDPEILKYLAQWQRLKEEHAIEVKASEITLVNTTLKYAGTADAIVKADAGVYTRDLHVLDYKTGKGVYDTYALQLALLSRCDSWLDASGELHSLKKRPNGDTALIAKLGPRSGHLYPVNIHVAWKYARLLVDLYQWLEGVGASTIGQPMPGRSEKADRLARDAKRRLLLERAQQLDSSARATVKAGWQAAWPKLTDDTIEWTQERLDAVETLLAACEKDAVA